MSRLHQCANGHEWDDGARSGSAEPICPECGAPGEDAIGDDGSVFGDELPPAPKPIPAAAPMPDLAEDVRRPFPDVRGYEILREVGRGGMGVVYQARDLRLHRLVALKMILSGVHTEPATLIRFLGEAEAVARLQHPNIVQIFDIGEYGGQPYLALEFLEGGNLASRLGQPLPADAVVTMLETLARAVQYAHDQGVVHRDLKPANILISESGFQIAAAKTSQFKRSSADSSATRKVPSAFRGLKITDFGLAKRLDGDSGTTQSGSVIGTPHYMPPEQAAGHAHEVGPASDVYALGAILYEMLTGRPPFVGTTPMETVMHVLNDEPAPPRLLISRIPRDLETICLKCLRKEPRQRYASAAELADDLGRFAAGKPIRARPVGWVERVWRWSRRNPLAAGLASAFIASLLLGIVVATFFAAQSDRRASRNLELKRMSDRHLYLARANLAMQAWQDGEVTRVLDLLTSMRADPADSVDLRGFEWYHLWYLCHRDDRLIIQAHDGQINSLAWSPDRVIFASAGDDKRVKLWNARTGDLLGELPVHEHEVECVAFHPGGRMLASSDASGAVRVWDVAHRQTIVSFDGENSPAKCLAFSPDGAWLAASSSGNLRRWRTADWRCDQWSEGKDIINSMAWTRDSSRVFAAGNDGRLTVWDVASPAPKSSPACDSSVRSLALSGDGRFLALGSSKGEIHLRDVADGHEVKLLPGLAEDAQALAFSADARFLISGGVSGAVKVHNLETGTVRLIAHTGPVQSFAPSADQSGLAIGGRDGKIKFANLNLGGDAALEHSDRIYGLAVAPDGKRVASASRDGSVRVWATTTGQLDAELHTGQVSVWCVCFSSDGKRLATGDSHGRVRVWNTESRHEEAAWDAHPKAVWGLAFSPDGHCLATAGYTDARIRLWDVGSGKVLRDLALPCDRAWCVAFSPDGDWLAAGGSQGDVTVWDAASGEVHFSVRAGTGWVWALAFSPDSAAIIAGPEDGRILLWNVHDGRLLQSFSGHASMARALGFFPDGQTIYSASDDAVIRLWDRVSGEERSTLRGHRDAIRAVVVTPDGGTLISGGYDQRIHYWRSTAREDVEFPPRAQGP